VGVPCNCQVLWTDEEYPVPYEIWPMKSKQKNTERSSLMKKKKLRKRIRQLETHVETASNTIVFLTKELLIELGSKIHPEIPADKISMRGDDLNERKN
jgi:hypothetical protein